MAKSIFVKYENRAPLSSPLKGEEAKEPKVRQFAVWHQRSSAELGVGVKQLVHVDDEVAHVRIVDEILSMMFLQPQPSRFSLPPP